MKQASSIAKAAVALVAALGAVASVQATPIIGIANLTMGAVLVSPGEVDWNPPVNPLPAPIGAPTYGSFMVSNITNTGSFTAVSGTAGSVGDLSANPGDGNYFPVGVSAGQPNFLLFSTQPFWLFRATQLEAGTIPGTPYVLTQVGTSTFASISISGTACDGVSNLTCDAGEDITGFSIALSAQYTNSTIASLTATLAGPDGLFFTADDGSLSNNTWSGTLEAFRLPEPGTLGIAGAALLGMAIVGRRRKA